MELEEMKVLWDDQKPVKQKVFIHQNISDMAQLTYNEQANNFKVGEIVGLVVAYTLAGIILYKFHILDNWYLRGCGIFLVIYFLFMPLYTMAGVRRMKKIDLAQSSYKEVLEHFYTVKSRLKYAEKISLIANPLLFIASMLVLTKILTDRDLFGLRFQFPVLILIVLTFIGSILFNVWAFKKRDTHLQSVKQLLEERINNMFKN